MDADILITQLRSKRAYIFVDNNELVIRVPPAVMTPEIIADIRNHKSEIINHLKTVCCSAALLSGLSVFVTGFVHRY